MAGTYTNSDRVNKYLPSTVETAVSAQIAQDIADASQIVESGVGSGFGFNYNSNADKFPSITDSPATPGIIVLAASYLAASMQWRRIKESIADGEMTSAQKYEDMGNKILEDIRNGVLTVDLSGANLKSSHLYTVEDDVYDDLDEAIFSKDNLDAHSYL